MKSLESKIKHHIFDVTKVKSINDTIYETPIEGLFYIARPTFDDDRGFFREVCNIDEVEELTGAKFKARQWNHARSNPNVIRGIHAEGWNKLVTVVSGRAFCALVDLREDSKTFLHVVNFELSGESGALFIPIGVGNSVAAISKEPVNYLYIVDRLYAERDPEGDKAIDLFDKDLGIEWPVKNPIVSDRDRDAVGVGELFGG